MEAANTEVTELQILRSLLERLDVVVHGDVCHNELQLVSGHEATRACMLAVTESKERLARVDELDVTKRRWRSSPATLVDLCMNYLVSYGNVPSPRK